MPQITSAKPPGRQTNNSLSSIPESILIASVQSSGSKKKPYSAKGSAKATTKKKDKLEKEASANSKENTKFSGANEDPVPKQPVKTKKGPELESGKSSSGIAKKQNLNASRKKNEKSAQVNKSSLIPTLSFTETDEVLQIGMHKVLEYVKNHKDAWPFMDPVEEDIAPRYYSIIRRPMDLLKMEEKLDNEEYLRYSDFRNDFKLIVNNCRLYNGHNNEYTEMVNSLQEAFERATKKYFEQNSSDEEEINQEYPDLDLKTSAFREKPATSVVPSISTVSSQKGDRDTHSVKGSKKEGSKDKNKSPTNSANAIGKDSDSVVVKKNTKKNLDIPKSSRNSKSEGTKNDNTLNEDHYDGRWNDDKEEDCDSESGNVNSSNQKAHKLKASKEVAPVKKTDNKTNATSDEIPKGSAKKTNKHNKNVHKIASNKGELNMTEDRSTDEDQEPRRSLSKGVKRKRKEKKRKKQQEVNDKSAAEEGITNPESHVDKVGENNDEDVEMQEVTVRKKHKLDKVSHSSKKVKDKSAKKDKHKGDVTGKIKGKKTGSYDNLKKLTPEESSKKMIYFTSNSKSTNLDSNLKGKHKSKSRVDKVNEDECLFSNNDQSDEENDVGPSPAKKPKKTHSTEHKSGKQKTKSKQEKKSVKNKSKKDGLASDNLTDLLGSSKKNKALSLSSPKKSTKSASKSKEVNTMKKGKKSGHIVDRMSVSSHEELLSRSSLGSPVFDGRDIDDTFDSTHSSDNRNLSRPITPDIKDKYDLIKQRRRNAGKSTAGESLSSGSLTGIKSKDKKLKGVKVDEKTQSISSDKDGRETDTASALFDRLREEDNEKAPKRSLDSPNKTDEYDFVDDSVAGGSTIAKGKTNSTNNNSKVVEASPKVDIKNKKGQMREPLPKPIKGSGTKKTNLEALELETEQTLKDINRWLEHTPRFPDYSSASNSPSRYMLEEFDSMDPNVFRRPATNNSAAALPSSKTSPTKSSPCEESSKKSRDIIGSPRVGQPTANSASGGSCTTNGPSTSASSSSATGMKKEVIKDKRKSLKDKIYNRKTNPSRTIDRMHPGKAKGNLLGSIQNINKPEELFPLGNLSKLKEVKNSLVVKADESGPKLSLGTVLDSDRFGLLQQHNFTEDKENDNKVLVEEAKSPVVANDPVDVVEEAPEPESTPKVVKDEAKLVEEKGDKSSVTPNLSAWFKAFGAPKVSKSDEENKEKLGDKETGLKSPSHKDIDSFNIPAAPRMRKASTGSTISERSSYSQDPDSPRIGMDERLGYGATQYTTSPMGSSPISLTSPKPDDMGKANYNLNGPIKVGFYQDTTQKSSPDKSCSPRDMPTPSYPQYSQPVYSATRAYANYYNTTSPVGTTAVSTTDTTEPTSGQLDNKTATNPANPVQFYDNYNKPPRSQESDYNSSMSPNPNSPYQQQHHSPYQQQHSPYDAHQLAPTQAQKTVNSNLNTSNPPYGQAHPPYQQPSPAQSAPQSSHINIQPSSPYSQSNQSSPYSQVDQISPYHPNSPSQATAQNSKSNHDAWSSSTVPAVGAPVGSGLGTASPASHAIPTAVRYDASRAPQPEINKPAAQDDNSKISPPKAHISSTPLATQQPQQHTQLPARHQQQYIHMGGQNLQPAHQNYPMYPQSLPTTHSKTYEDPQSLLMSHHNLNQSHHLHNQMRPDQGMYTASNEVPAHVKTAVPEGSTSQQSHQNMFDLMSLRKSPFGNIPNISTSKAFEMFNRAATFSKSLGSSAPAAEPAPINSTGTNAGSLNKEAYDINLSKSSYGNTFDMLKNSQTEQLNLGSGGNGSSASTQLAKTAVDLHSQQLQPQHPLSAGHNPHQYGSSRRATDLVIPNPRASADQPLKAGLDAAQQQQTHQQQQQQRYDYSAMAQMASYRSSPFGATSQQHLSSIGLDERLMGMPQHPASGYYDKSLSQNMFAAKQSAMAYGNSYGAPASDPKPMDHQSAVSQPVPPLVTKSKKGVGRGKKSKTATPPSEAPSQANLMHNTHLQMNQQGQLAQPAHNLAMGPSQHGGHIQSQQHHHGQDASAHHTQQQQGFQSYSNLKTAIAAASTTAPSGNTAADASAISLKTASMMPASAFNFGTGSTGLGLYGENSYLDDFRNPANHYYLPPSSAQANDKAGGSGATSSNQGGGVGNPATGSSAAAVAAATQSAAAYHQFLSHQPARPPYPFINSQLDTSSPLYQQYFQRRQDEIRAQMILNQGLLGPHPGAPPGAYGQPGYHHPSLGMHKPPYDTMNRPSWL